MGLPDTDEKAPDLCRNWPTAKTTIVKGLNNVICGVSEETRCLHQRPGITTPFNTIKNRVPKVPRVLLPPQPPLQYEASPDRPGPSDACERGSSLPPPASPRLSDILTLIKMPGRPAWRPGAAEVLQVGLGPNKAAAAACNPLPLIYLCCYNSDRVLLPTAAQPLQSLINTPVFLRPVEP